MLFSILKDIFFPKKKSLAESLSITSENNEFSGVATNSIRKVLNVGGNSKAILIPTYYEGWEHLLLDIDSRGNPDIVCDSRLLSELNPRQFDAVYCSHNLEHYFQHDVGRVLAGFHNVLTDDGFVDITVPDMGELMRTVVNKKLDIEDLLYESPSGPIHVIDVIYGWRLELEMSGNDFFAHKTGFTEKSLIGHLSKSGFTSIFTSASNLEVRAIAFKQEPTLYAKKLLGLDSLQDMVIE